MVRDMNSSPAQQTVMQITVLHPVKRQSFNLYG
jgi:hypothetical protein